MDDKRNREARHITRITLDDGALLPVVARSEDINIIVAGGAGKHSLFIPSVGITRSVTKPIHPSSR